jgi:hypothetical protein
MVSLRMVAIYLLPRLADLLDDEKLRVSFDDPFDLRLFVSGRDDEAVTLTHDGCIAVRRDLDPFEAGGAAAFAVKRQRPGHCVLLGAFLDLLVHAAKDLLVSRSPFSEIHRRDPPFGVSAQPRPQPAARFLQKRCTLDPIHLPSIDLAALPAGATLDRNIKAAFAAIDPAASVGEEPPLLPPAPRAQRKRQQQITS